MTVRKWLTIREEVHTEAGRSDDGGPLVKVAVCAVVDNPFAGRWADDLDDLVQASVPLADELAARAVDALGAPPLSYGKGGLVGVAGEQEHINAMLTTVFGEAMRQHAGGGLAWIPSMTKRASAGEMLDVPLAHKDALYVRAHYDGITVHVPDAPGPDEMVVVGAYANRGRINARIGGVPADAITARDGLR
ncbi:MAG TPA: amino acid synthesis family protein [Capillimicrobium sp.]|nr:amino acid synthesis family protein [Capillimicrobium sp.]